MNILVTGASGFIGQALVRALCPLHNVFGTTRRSETVFPSQVHKIIWDCSGDAPDRLPSIDVVVHLAARVHVMHDDTPDPLAEFRAANVDATQILARRAAAQGAKRFVFLSSIKVNGEATQAGQAFGADDAPQPMDAYAISKCEAEQLLMEVGRATGMEIVIIRPPLVYGPGAKGNFNSMIRWLQKGIPLPLGAVDNRRSLVALDNLVDFIALCANREKSSKASNETFLISDGEDVSTSELLTKVAQAYQVRTRLIPVSPGLIRLMAGLTGKAAVADRLLGSLVIDSAKARNLLGWRPVVTMDEQLRKMAQHDASMA